WRASGRCRERRAQPAAASSSPCARAAPRRRSRWRPPPLWRRASRQAWPPAWRRLSARPGRGQGQAPRAGRLRAFESSSGSFQFFGTARRDGERVNGILHQLAEGMVHHPVTRYGRLAAEARRDDLHPPVRAAAGARAGVSGVLRALVDGIKRDRLERRKALPDALGNVHCLSSTYLARYSACTTRPSSSRVAPPNTAMMPRLAHGIASTRRFVSFSQPTCTNVAAIATAVAT